VLRGLQEPLSQQPEAQFPFAEHDSPSDLVQILHLLEVQQPEEQWLPRVQLSPITFVLAQAF
jgi:hypothetical protein